MPGVAREGEAWAVSFGWLAIWRGAIAQLGERLLCKQEVVGSIPSGSTSRIAVRPVARPFAVPSRRYTRPPLYQAVHENRFAAAIGDRAACCLTS